MAAYHGQSNDAAADRGEDDPSAKGWTANYGERHRWRRIAQFPEGIEAPERVRIYARADRFVLNWWDPSSRKNLSLRIDGDLVSAIGKAREIEQRLEDFKSSGGGRKRIRHAELVAAYLADLRRRADAGEIDPGTVVRYQSALAHYEGFAEQPEIESRYPFAARVDREFALELAIYLNGHQIHPNGHPNARKRRMASTGYVEAVVAGMFRWASAPGAGELLPDGFRNPFAGHCRKTTAVAPDLFGEPDITVVMAVEFMMACDAFQLTVFALLALYGLRPSELSFLFRENVADGWLSVVCDSDLGVLSKGRRNKKLPLVEEVPLPVHNGAPRAGLLFVRRSVAAQRETPPLLGTSLDSLREVFADRCGRERRPSAADRVRVRDDVLRDAGGISYDHIEHEFRGIARRLRWPHQATLKDFRHLFNTLLQNAGMPEFYRRYLLGHSPGKSALVNYTHVNELRQSYMEAVGRSLRPLVDAVRRRAVELGLAGSAATTAPARS